MNETLIYSLIGIGLAFATICCIVGILFAYRSLKLKSNMAKLQECLLDNYNIDTTEIKF